jgi:protein-S-isoprenylcysteine O-methyltransferase Ste14
LTGGRGVVSLLPAFKIGVLNAWILMLYYPLHPVLMLLIDQLVGTGGIYKKMADAPYSKTEKLAFIGANALSFILLLYSIFLPLKLGSGWFYAGMVVYLFGLVMFLVAIGNIATTPPGVPFVKGLYRYSRHPMVFFSFFTFTGVGIAAASWLFLLLSAIVIVCFAIYVVAEERGCCDRFGDSYRGYMDRTPRWFGLPKTGKSKSPETGGGRI